MDYVIALLVFAEVMCGVMAIRNNIVYGIRCKANKIISEHCNSLIRKGEYQSGYDYFAVKGSYDKMMWQLHKWTFKQFYPDGVIEK